MNKTAIYSTVVVSVIASLAVFAVTSSEIEAVPPSKVACPAENVQHWETWRFRYSLDLTHTSNPTLQSSIDHYIKFKVDPLQPNEPRKTIVDTIVQLGYTDSNGTPTLDNLSTTVFQSSTIICGQN